MTIIGAAVLGVFIVIGLVEWRRTLIALNKDMRAILDHQSDIRRRLDRLEQERGT